jgi:hypothetical protein
MRAPLFGCCDMLFGGVGEEILIGSSSNHNASRSIVDWVAPITKAIGAQACLCMMIDCPWLSLSVCTRDGIG